MNMSSRQSAIKTDYIENDLPELLDAGDGAQVQRPVDVGEFLRIALPFDFGRNFFSLNFDDGVIDRARVVLDQDIHQLAGCAAVNEACDFERIAVVEAGELGGFPLRARGDVKNQHLLIG